MQALSELSVCVTTHQDDRQYLILTGYGEMGHGVHLVWCSLIIPTTPTFTSHFRRRLNKNYKMFLQTLPKTLPMLRQQGTWQYFIGDTVVKCEECK